MKVRLKDAALVLRRRALQLEPAVRAAERASLDEALKIALELSSGTVSTRQLARMGHPYAKRHQGSIPGGDAALINRQRDQGFYQGWKIRPPRSYSGGLRSSLINTTPYAHFLTEGTDRMIPRPILERIAERLAPFRERRLRQEIRKALSGR